MSMPLKIDAFYAFVATDKDGQEGLMAFMDPTGAWMPMVGADLERVKSLAPFAQDIANRSGLPYRLLKFSTRTDVTELLR